MCLCVPITLILKSCSWILGWGSHPGFSKLNSTTFEKSIEIFGKKWGMIEKTLHHFRAPILAQITDFEKFLANPVL